MVTAARQPATLVTSAQFANMFGADDRVELWRGIVVEMSPVNHLHSRIAFRLNARLSMFVIEHGLGEVWPADTGYTIEVGPDTVVAPDLAFAPQAYAKTVTKMSRGFPFFIPPLVVEVKSPNDSEREIAEKLALYLAAGVGEIWWVRPMEETLTRQWLDRSPRTLGRDDLLDAVEALPGFSMEVRDVFPPE